MPATLTYPGVYIEEIPSGVHTITGVATSIGAFAGWAPQGPINQATLVESWSDFQTQFGGFSRSNGSPNYLGYAVNQFFNNGGQQAYIVRLVADGNDGTMTAGVATVNLTDINNNTFLTLQAASPGNWATSYGIAIKASTADPTRFSLSVIYVPSGGNPQVVESFQNLSLSPSDPLYVVTVINSDSNFVAFAPGYNPPNLLLPPSSNIPTSPFMLTGTLPIFLQDNSAPPNTYLEVQANQPSRWPANFGISIKTATNGLPNNFDLEVLYNPASGAVGVSSVPLTVESFPNLSVNPNDPNYAATTINQNSNFLTVPSNYIPLGNAATIVLHLPSTFSAASTVQLTNTGTVPVQDHSSPPATLLTLQASSPSTWPQYFGLLAQADAAGFDLEVVYYPASGPVGNLALPVVLELFKGLTVTTPTITKSQFIALPAGYTPPSPVPALSLPTIFPPAPTMLVPNLDGTILQPNTAAFENKMLDVHGNGTNGVYLLKRVAIFNLLCVPGETSKLGASAAVLAQLQAFCVQERAFLIVDSDITDTYSNLQKNGPSSAIIAANSTNAALYFPWVQAPDPLFGNRLTYFPPCGFVAGIFAATDATRGVWKAPAGIDAGLTGASGLQYTLTDLENGGLNVLGINSLRQFSTYGNVVWGARTLQGSDQAGSQWKYIPIRRLALYIESSLYEGTQWVVFEPNDEPLWGQIRLNVGAFMQGLFLQGAFEGSTPAQAYFVKCDSENNPQASIDLGIVNILVGFAPLYPAEFVVIQIQQIAGQLQS
jgi:phage tail sheath protein FI